MTDIDWDDAFANAAYIENGESFYEYWPQKSAAFRDGWENKRLDQRYGPANRETYDLFIPETHPAGLLIFVHGGYWMATDKSYWSYLASGAVQLGWQVAIVQYTLAPNATLPEITLQVGRAIDHLAQNTDTPIHLVGHSAGGHLVSRMGCKDAPLADTTKHRVKKITSISGLHDLTPLMNTKMNDQLQLTPETAREESVALRTPNKIPITAWTGADERPEFLRQAKTLFEAWPHAKLVIEPNKHHFDVIDGLCYPDADLLKEVLHP
ncbi:MAG: alpha/beta hydrolase [Pseudomonadota bacterium]